MWQIKGDSEGRLDMTLIGEGTGYYITQGKAIPIYWEKKEAHSPTTYYTENKELLLMNPGKTYVGLYPTYRENKLKME